MELTALYPTVTTAGVLHQQEFAGCLRRLHVQVTDANGCTYQIVYHS
jgi:hypothetical protein